MQSEIRSGKATRERRLAVCTGTVSLAPADRAELLAILAGDSDSLVAERAAHALLSIPVETFVAALGRTGAAIELFRYCAENLGGKTPIADAMARNPNCPVGALCQVAAALSPMTVEALIDDLDRLTQYPPLISALLQHPSLTVQQRALLEEMLREEMGEMELAEMIAFAEPDRAKRESLFQRLARMKVVERVQLALKGNREERLALIRDPCKVVQRAVLQSPKLSDSEVEGFAAMANLSEDILRVIARNRNFLKNYVIVKNLLNNSKTPLDVSLHLLPRLTPLDLRMLTTNKNIPDTLRTMALKLHRQRSEAARRE